MKKTSKLPSLGDFILYQLSVNQSSSEFKEVVKKYTLFLGRKLNIGMFIPCDEIGLILDNPECSYNIELCTNPKCVEYFKGKNNVMFDDFKLENGAGVIVYNNYFRIWFTEGKCFLNNTYTELKSVSDLVEKVHLTESAIKKLGL